MFLIFKRRSSVAVRLMVVAAGIGVTDISPSAQEPSAGTVTLVFCPSSVLPIVLPLLPPSVGVALTSSPPGVGDWIWFGSGSAWSPGALARNDGSVVGEPEPEPLPEAG